MNNEQENTLAQSSSESDTAVKKNKRKRKTLKEMELFHKKKAEELRKKISLKERKERTRRLIEIGAYVESILKTSSKEETIKTIQSMFKNYCAILKLQEQKMREENEH